MPMQKDKTLDKFAKMDISQYAGMAVGIVDGKILFKNKDPGKVLKQLLSQKGNKDTALICVPNTKTAMAI